MNTITELLQPNCTIEKDGIFVTKDIANKTVWDDLAQENPTHAVISAPNEAEAEKKSIEQIADIKKHLNAGDVLLDYGSGYGRVAKYLLPQMSLKGYVALDSSFNMLRLFQQRYKGSEVEQQTPVLFVNADINAIPLKKQSVDAAVVCAVFLHNHKSIVVRSMQELTDAMKPGGTVLVYSSFPRLASLMGIQGWLYQMLLNILGRPFKNGPVRYYRSSEVYRLFSDFADVELVPVGYALLPKTIIILPWPLEVVYRKGIANPLNSLLDKITPQPLKRYFASHYDVIAKR